MLSSRTQSHIRLTKPSVPSKFPRIFEFQVLLYLSISELTVACSVSKEWRCAANNIDLWKMAINYLRENEVKEAKKDQHANLTLKLEKEHSEESKVVQEDESKKNSTDNRLLGYLIKAIKLQNTAAVYRFIVLGVKVEETYYDKVILEEFDTPTCQKTTILNPTPLMIAAAVSSEEQGADIVYILLSHGADVYKVSDYTAYSPEENCNLHDYYFPSEFAVRAPKIQKFLLLTQLEEDAKRRQLDQIDCTDYFSIGQIACFVLTGLFVGTMTIGCLIVAPLIIGPLLSLLILLCCGPTIVSEIKEWRSNQTIRRDFHNLLSEESKKPPMLSTFKGGLFSKLWPCGNNSQTSIIKTENEPSSTQISLKHG